MSLDSAVPVVLALVSVVTTAVLLAARWDRLRVLSRSVLTAATLLSVLATVGLQVNRMTEAFPSAERPTAASAQAGTGSQLLTVTVAGTASHLTVPMYVYLPAAYRTGSTRFPVIEALHGYPGSPRTWLRRLRVQSYLDSEIASGRMAPTVVLFPYQTPRQLLDTECTNIVGGPRAETLLTTDVPAYAREHLRIRTDRAGWGLTGYSAGAYCAINLLLRHPDRYAAAAALSGYASPGITVGDGSEKTGNNDGWRLRNLPQPTAALWLGWAADDGGARRDSVRLAGLARPPLAVTTAVVPHGGHSDAVWRQMEAPAFDWLSAHLARPL